MFMSLEDVSDRNQLIIDRALYKVPAESRNTYLVGYMSAELAHAFNKMSPEEQEKFFPNLTEDLSKLN